MHSEQFKLHTIEHFANKSVHVYAITRITALVPLIGRIMSHISNRHVARVGILQGYVVGPRIGSGLLLERDGVIVVAV